MNEVSVIVSDKYVSRGGFGTAKKEVKELSKEVKALGDQGTKSGAALKSGLSSSLEGVSGVLTKALSNPYVAGAAAAGAASIGLLAGGAVAGGVVAGLGAGIAGIGVVAAAKSGAVRTEFSKLSKDIGDDLRSISGPFQQSLIDIANSARVQFGKIKPALANAFQSAAPAVTNFGENLARSLARLGPSFSPIIEGFNAVLNDLGPRLPGLVSRIGDVFSRLSDSIAESPEALGDMIDTLGNFVVVFTDTLRILNEGYASFRDFMSVLAGTETIAGHAVAASDGIKQLGDSTNTAAKAGRRYEEALNAMADAEGDVTKQGQALLDMLDLMAGRTPDYTDALAKAADSISGLSINFKDADDKAKGFGKTLLDQSGAFDVTNENGRELYEQVREVEGAFANMAAAVANGQGSREQFINDANRMRDRLNETWRQAGLTERQIASLNEEYGLTPSQISTSVALLGVGTAEQQLAFLTRTRTASVYIQTLGLGSVNGNPVFHDIYGHGGITSTAATGGNRGGEVIINEQGPEAVRLPNGSTVMPAGSTRALEQRWAEGGGGGTVIEWVGGPTDELGRAIYQWLQKNMRIRGAAGVIK